MDLNLVEQVSASGTGMRCPRIDELALAVRREAG